MALVSQTIASAVVTPSAMAAPTTNETVSAPGPGKFLQVVIGATTTTVTVVRPNTHPGGDSITDYTTGAIVSTERWIPITRDYRDPDTGLATVTFSQVTNVTARLVTVNQ